MKHTTAALLGFTLLSSIIFTSCNKKLKDNVKELDEQISELQSQNEALQNEVNGVSSAIGSNEPITAITSFTNDNSTTTTWSDTYRFKASNYQTQYMEDNGNGTYDIYIERFADVDWNEGIWLTFTYNPTTGAITERSTGHYWDWNLPYNTRAYYVESLGNCSVAITLSSISVATGDIVLSVIATSNDAYGTSNTSYVPRSGIGATTQFSFSGKLKVYPAN